MCCFKSTFHLASFILLIVRDSHDFLILKLGKMRNNMYLLPWKLPELRGADPLQVHCQSLLKLLEDIAGHLGGNGMSERVSDTFQKITHNVVH